jgi:hypothetical protein
MKIIGCTLADLLRIAQETRVRIANTGAWNYRRAPHDRVRKDGRPETSFTLRTLYREDVPKGEAIPYRRHSNHQNRNGEYRTIGGPLCWHGHRDFMARLFDEFPSAVLTSAFARYEEKTGFLRNFAETGTRNIGSQASPMYYQNACFCGEEIHFRKVA